MAKFQVLIETINAVPANHPVPTLAKVWDNLEKHLKRNVSPMLVRDMNATVRGWKNKPNMTSKITRPYGTRLQLEVRPTGRGTTNWARINKGTGPRTIRAKTPKGMSFQTKYDPKTTPRGRYGGPGRKYGPWRRGVKRVRHRIEPREFTVKIYKKRNKQISKGIQRVVRRTR